MKTSSDDLLRDYSGPFPRDIQTDVLLTLNVAIVLLGRLSVDAVNGELKRRRLGITCDVPDRLLSGCLVARADFGLIFVDGSDPVEEQRFTVAHEAAHFVVDYCEPRNAARKRFGDGILSVFDGQRDPSDEERVDAFLARVPLKTHLHLMARDGRHAIAACESRADNLAFNFLAPPSIVRRLVSQRRAGDRAATASRILVETFGLPIGPAQVYGRRLYPPDPNIPLRKLLGL